MRRDQAAFFKACLADALIGLMEEKPFDEISVSDICVRAEVGRTTYYRHCDRRNGKEDLLVFKLRDEWARYARKHREETARDRGFALTCFVYENRELFALLDRHGLVPVLMRAVEALLLEGGAADDDASYLAAFFTYGYFGILYRWIRRGFLETPEQLRQQTTQVLAAGPPGGSRGS